MTYQVLSPIDGHLLRDVHFADPNDIDARVAAAVRAQSAWSRVHPTRRGEILFGIAEMIESRLDEIAGLETRNTGKLLFAR